MKISKIYYKDISIKYYFKLVDIYYYGKVFYIFHIRSLERIRIFE
jgi:hypothetical protein